MRTKNNITTALCCLLLTVLSVCDAKESSDPTISAAPSPYPILDSGVWADALHNSFIYWLDNNRVLFKNSEEKEKAKHYRGRFNLSIWDTRTNKVTPYSEYAKSLSVCYREGFIYYTMEDEKKNKRRFAGEFGKEKPFVPPATKNVRYIEMDCRFYADPAPIEKLEGSKRHDLKFLLFRDGYLDYGSVFDNKKDKLVLYYRKGADKPIPLPELNRQYINYYEFKDAYFVHYSPFGAWNPTTEVAWWLYPDGRMENVKIPEGAYNKGGGNFYPLRDGIFITYRTFKSGKDAGDAGGYLAKNNTAIKVITGYLQGITISPDGCRIAFSHYSYPDATLIADLGRITLKMINFCTEEKSP